MDEVTASTLAAVERFSVAFNRKDVDGVMAAMTEDCVFENTGPAPDGERYVGAAALREFWDEFFQSNPRANFMTEEQFTASDRCVVRWRYDWGAGHVRGVDVFRVSDGRVAEKLCYVKG
ncbi:MAG: nuclear transport factor 2 family protein [Chloroflexota bacterium]|nr:nuclear transport factor 2 family protein [Chloroflexota bacterium]